MLMYPNDTLHFFTTICVQAMLPLKKKTKTSRSKGFHLSRVLSGFAVDRLRGLPATTVAPSDDCELELTFWWNTAGAKEFAEHLYPAKRDEVAELLADGSRFAPILDHAMEASAMKAVRGMHPGLGYNPTANPRSPHNPLERENLPSLVCQGDSGLHC